MTAPTPPPPAGEGEVPPQAAVDPQPRPYVLRRLCSDASYVDAWGTGFYVWPLGTGEWPNSVTFSTSSSATTTLTMSNFPVTMSTTNWTGPFVLNLSGDAIHPPQPIGAERMDEISRNLAERNLAEQQRQADENRARWARQDEQRRVARTRARAALVELLSPEQRASFERHGHFEVVGSEGHRYRIERGVQGNVMYVDEHGNDLGRLCAHPSMQDSWLPDHDVALAQMLALTTDEQSFVAIAGVHYGRRPEFEGAVLLDQAS